MKTFQPPRKEVLSNINHQTTNTPSQNSEATQPGLSPSFGGVGEAGLGRQGWLHRLYSSVFGIGYIKGGGTVAALFCCLCLYTCWHFGVVTQLGFVITTVLITISGIWSGNVVEAGWGKDSSKVVIDEVAGMCVSLLFIKLSFWSIVTGLILFRFFDIAKPLGIRRLEALPGGWGVMADDILAGVYANLVLQGFIWLAIHKLNWQF